MIRYDDDPYLVVAADKGTATFSDIANSIAVSSGFWLGDAFASGGSAGYDHKAMGITARGAWESVRRHFREMGVDCQTEDVTCVGIGDMSGDVFGNGMLLSKHLKLIAAFDHRHVFVDPTPDPATSWNGAGQAVRPPGIELGRLRPRADLRWRRSVSADGESRSRSRPPMHKALGIPAAVESLTPAGLINACLKAPVDLLWNGGIGTYVKATNETHAEVGDKANDVPASMAAELRASCVGEGGNLGFTHAVESSTPLAVADQHRLHRQFRRGRHVRPRGQHQDLAVQ